VAVLLILASLARPVFGVMGYTLIMMLRPGTVFPFFASIRVELLEACSLSW